jgi:hypothetical protein
VPDSVSGGLKSHSARGPGLISKVGVMSHRPKRMERYGRGYVFRRIQKIHFRGEVRDAEIMV